MQARGCSAKARAQRRRICAVRFREAEAARAMSVMARLSAALVVDFTRIPSSIDVRQF
jgi:hypothetical protein